MSTEADARMLIDKLLETAGWAIINKAQVSTEEASADGRADYLLKDSRTRPLAVIEAKRFVIDPYSAKEQALDYAQSLGVPFIILSNGQEHYFWDYADGDARRIMGMPSQADLERRANIKIHRKGSLPESLNIIPYPSRFIFKGEELEPRPYQLECLKRADDALISGRRRKLFEMATGTGKTLTIAMLHGFDQSPIVQRDSICGSEDRWDEVQFDYILENPLFSGSRGDAKRSLRVEKGDKYVLFLAHALKSLCPGGTAGIIFPDGILFGDTNSHITVKERLLREFDLQAVVMLPKGMFEPYTLNPTCFFIFKNTGRPTKNVWFFNVEGDGSSLKKARKFGPQYRNDFPDLLSMWPGRKTEESRAWLVPAKKIIDNGYNMTLSSLELIKPETMEYPEPEEILASVAAKEERILGLIQEMRELMEGGNG